LKADHGYIQGPSAIVCVLAVTDNQVAFNFPVIDPEVI